MAKDQHGPGRGQETTVRAAAPQVEERLEQLPATFQVGEISVTADMPMPQFDEVQEVRGSETTDGGFFPLKQGNELIAYCLGKMQVPSQFGTTQQLELAGGAKAEAKMQTVYIMRGTGRILTPAGVTTVSGNFKLAETARLVLAMERYSKDPHRIAKITVLGQEGKKQKRDGSERDGAWLYDVREVVRRPQAGAAAG